MEVLSFMGLVTPLIQLCRVISSGMVDPSYSQSSFDEYCLICRVLSTLSVYRRPCVSPSMILDLLSGEGVSTVGTHLHDPINTGLAPWRMSV